MYLNRLAAILGSLFYRRRSLVVCPIRRSAVRICLVVVAALIISPPLVEASVLISGDVTPSDNPFTTVIESLPSAGNKVDPFATPTPAEQNQTLWEGINDPINNTNINTDVYVGKTGTGILQISQVELRDMNLVIGDSGTITGSQFPRFGDGTVYITGMGSLFNNDPYLLPPGLPSSFSSKRPRLSEGAGQYVTSGLATVSDGLDGAGDGFDLYVGRTGTGTLKIDAFGRAEIADAVLVGDSAGATGNLVIDGFNSTLTSGGSHDYGPTTDTDSHMTIIGRQGTGNLWITNGATMSTWTFAADGTGGTQGPVAASLGSSPFSPNSTGNQMPTGGNGIATVAGVGSKWVLGGSLQVGGFDNGTSNGGVFSTGGDLEGDDTDYGSQAGRGTLNVNDGAIVNVQYSINGAPTGGGGNQGSLLLAIGRFGRVQLNGGTIQVGSGQGDAGGGQNQATPDNVQVINDGLITGSGRINTGVFRNRYYGTVRVEAGQSLLVDSSSQFLVTGGATPVEPLTNYGMIQVLGNSQAQAQLEFVRAPADPTNPVRPLINLPLGTLTTPPPAPPAFVGGQISAQYANLRFGSGLENRSMLAFTAGTNNITGRVVSVDDGVIDTDANGDTGDTAQVLVSGPGTTAVFHDDLVFEPGADLNLVDGGKVVVLNQHSFVMGGGNLNIELSYAHPSLITVGGDVGIGPFTGNNDLSLTLASDVLSSLKHGDSFEIISFTGDIGNVKPNPSNALEPIIDYTAAPLFTDIDVSPDVFALHNLVPQVQFASQGVYVTFLDPTMVGPGAGAIAPDFNGDGVVDLADFNIWQMHVGTTSGASVLDGDADGDGDVDGQDFLKWQRNVGKPMPWTGAGAGSGSSLAAIPEPASLGLVLSAGSLALAFCGRRKR